jgi:hypothetical protein
LCAQCFHAKHFAIIAAISGRQPLAAATIEREPRPEPRRRTAAVATWRFTGSWFDRLTMKIAESLPIVWR